MPEPVSVTVTFLFTDIEGSSRMWELDPAAMDDALHLHNRLATQTFRANRGKVFKSMGDAFCVAFEDAADATRAAIETQIALSRQTWPESTGPLRIRIGLHTGAAILDDGDYFGPTLNRVARIMSSAHGGQIVVSTATFAVLGAPPNGVAFRDLGVKRLKDLEQPERLYQVIAEGLTTQFPPLRTLDEHPNNLPTQLSSFVGRRAELERLSTAFESARVVTIAGPGGIGKTRLALQFAAESAHRFPGGAFFVELANVTDRVLVPHAVATALGLAENGAEKPVETIARFIGEKSMLLIVDNSEHLLGEVATFVKTLGSTCANLSVLVTSREPLHLMGERVERLASMSLPERVDASELETSDGCRLFLERARAAGTDFASLQNDAESIVSICRRLEGIPLAIEIAASRTATLSPKKLSQRLDAHLLVNKDPTVTERHRTLAKAIEWSYRLLENDERSVFVAMSVFRGGCTLEALTAVAGSDVDVELESLLDKSLVYEVSNPDGDPRYRFSDPTREFAVSERAAEDDLEKRHFEYFAKVVLQADETIEACHRRIARELDNIRAALDCSITRKWNGAPKLVLSMTSYWRARSAFTEARLWLDRVRNLATASESTRADIIRYCASFAVMQDDYENAIALAEEALSLYREDKVDFGIGAALHTLGEIAHRQGRYEEADSLYTESYSYLESAGNLLGTATCLKNRGLLARQRNDLSAARALLQAADEKATAAVDSNLSIHILIERGWIAVLERNTGEAKSLFNLAISSYGGSDNAHAICQSRLGRATALLIEGSMLAAFSEFDEALREAHQIGAWISVVDAVFGIAAVEAKSGRLEASARCYAIGEQMSKDLHIISRFDIAKDLADSLIDLGLAAELRASAANLATIDSQKTPEALLRLFRELLIARAN